LNGTRPSPTALADLCAAARSAESERSGRLFFDPRAAAFAGTAIHWLARLGGDRTLAALAARTRWFDERILRHACEGYETIVLLGAGFDARWARLETAARRWIAIDVPEVIGRVESKPREPHVMLRSGDLGSGEFVRETVEIATSLEGLLPYLGQAAALSLVSALGAITVPAALIADVPSVRALQTDPDVQRFRDSVVPSPTFATNEPAAIFDTAWTDVDVVHLGHPEAHFGRLESEPSRALADDGPALFLCSARSVARPSTSLARLNPEASLDELSIPLRFVEAEAGTDDIAMYVQAAAGNPGPILDVGAGTGRLCAALAKCSLPVTALDSSLSALGVCAKTLRDAGLPPPAVELVHADARAWRSSPRFALALLSLNFLHHLPERFDQLRVLQNVAASLLPDGKLLIDLPNEPGNRRAASMAAVGAGTSASGERFERHQESSAADAHGRYRVRGYYELVASGQHFEFEYDCRSMSLIDLLDLLRRSALAEVERWGSYAGEPWSAASPRLIVLARRRPA